MKHLLFIFLFASLSVQAKGDIASHLFQWNGTTKEPAYSYMGTG